MEHEVDLYISLRENGLESKAIRKKLCDKGLSDDDIRQVMKNGELQYLNSIERPNPKPAGSKLLLKSFVLVLFIGILTLVWAGYAYVGFGAMILLWLLLRNTRVLGKQNRAKSLFDKSDPF